MLPHMALCGLTSPFHIWSNFLGAFLRRNFVQSLPVHRSVPQYKGSTVVTARYSEYCPNQSVPCNDAVTSSLFQDSNHGQFSRLLSHDFRVILSYVTPHGISGVKRFSVCASHNFFNLTTA